MSVLTDMIKRIKVSNGNFKFNGLGYYNGAIREDLGQGINSDPVDNQVQNLNRIPSINISKNLEDSRKSLLAKREASRAKMLEIMNRINQKRNLGRLQR